mmetsp:Transcript_25826/g.76507  ORF Transcript_25826/g.76507 Transcript_25826/m.76507 type:complete len:82 (-) Transcript_25826:195-440(-)
MKVGCGLTTAALVHVIKRIFVPWNQLPFTFLELVDPSPPRNRVRCKLLSANGYRLLEEPTTVQVPGAEAAQYPSTLLSRFL